jgi:hypothetical protein
MKSLLEKVDELDRLIRQLHKMESKMRSGQWIDAWRDVNRIFAKLEADKALIIKMDKEGQA